jgi:hypothetical protein
VLTQASMRLILSRTKDGPLVIPKLLIICNVVVKSNYHVLSHFTTRGFGMDDRTQERLDREHAQRQVMQQRKEESQQRRRLADEAVAEVDITLCRPLPSTLLDDAHRHLTGRFAWSHQQTPTKKALCSYVQYEYTNYRTLMSWAREHQLAPHVERALNSRFRARIEGFLSDWANQNRFRLPWTIRFVTRVTQAGTFFVQADKDAAKNLEPAGPDMLVVESDGRVIEYFATERLGIPSDEGFLESAIREGGLTLDHARGNANRRRDARLAAEREAQRPERERREAEQRRQQEEQGRAHAAFLRKWRANATDPDCPYKSIKEAKSDGWMNMRDAFYAGEMLLIKGHRLTKNPKVAISETAWRKKGYEVFDRRPHATLHFHPGRVVFYDVYRDDQVRACVKIAA